MDDLALLVTALAALLLIDGVVDRGVDRLVVSGALLLAVLSPDGGGAEHEEQQSAQYWTTDDMANLVKCPEMKQV